MNTWPAPRRRRSSTAAGGTTAAGLALAVALLVAGCTPEAADSALPSLADTPATTAGEPTVAEDPSAAVLDAYTGYLGALTQALAAGDPADPQLAEHATGAALQSAQQQLTANQSEGLIATGTLQPAATAAEVTVDGDRATVQDCLLNDLAQVRAGNPDEVVQPASGNRQPLTATLTREGNAWRVSETTGPELRGPVLQGESCAPPALQQQLLTQYEAYWDALYQAGDPGDGQPANPGEAQLAATTMDPQLADTTAFLTGLRDAGQVLRGRPDTQASVLGLFNYDQTALLVDCVIEPENTGLYEVATGERVGGGVAGSRTSTRTEMQPADGTWKVRDFDLIEEAPCERDGG